MAKLRGKDIHLREEKCWSDGQHECYEALWLQLDAPLRLEIRIDTSVPHQSKAIAYVFSRAQMRWNDLTSIPYPLW